MMMMMMKTRCIAVYVYINRVGQKPDCFFVTPACLYDVTALRFRYSSSVVCLYVVTKYQSMRYSNSAVCVILDLDYYARS